MAEEKDGPGEQRARKDKCELATYYFVGVRTIENWQSREIISALQKVGKKFVFDVSDCDRRLVAQTMKIDIYAKHQK